MTAIIHGSNPRPRARRGFLPLTMANVPRPEELTFDKVGLRVRATMGALQEAPSRDVFEHYRSIMIERAQSNPGVWSVPKGERAVFRTKLIRKLGTIADTVMWARWEDEAHTLNIWMNVNPTRTLHHLVRRFPEENYLGAALESLPVEEFFGVMPDVEPVATLDGNDNALADLDHARERMGADYGAAFIGTFERQLRRWVTDVVAPRRAGFREEASGRSTLLASDWLGIELEWSSLVIREAEVYVERRQPGAAHVMNRANHAVLAGHDDVQYSLHDLGEHGGRSGGSTSIGVRQTQGITLKYYAKTADRIRGEVVYRKCARDVAGDVPRDACNPLQQVLKALRVDAASRMRWEQFCELVAIQPAVSPADLARLATIVAEAARRSKVDPEPVLCTLLETGGVTETHYAGQFPRRLNKRLEKCGVLQKSPLLPRSRPGHARRYCLVPLYLEVVRLTQLGFREGQLPA